MDNYLNRWGFKLLSVWELMTKAIIGLVLTRLRLVDHTYNTLPQLWIKTRRITVLIITPQKLNNFNSQRS